MSHEAGTRLSLEVSSPASSCLGKLPLQKGDLLGSTRKQSKWICSFSFSFLMHLAIPGPK